MVTENSQKVKNPNFKKCPINQMMTSYTHITSLQCSFQTYSSTQTPGLNIKLYYFTIKKKLLAQFQFPELLNYGKKDQYTR